MMYKLAMSRVSDLLASFGKVIAPIERAEQVNFGAWSPEETLRLDVLKTVNSAKDAFFPQSEDIVHFKMEGKNIAIGMPEKPDEPFVLFGARACDVRALDVLDRVFLSEPADPGYAARRKNGTIVSIACARPAEDLVDIDEIQNEWTKTPGVNVHLTIDRAQEGWDGHVAFVPAFVTELGFDPNKTVLVCGPPVMIKFTLKALMEQGFKRNNVYTTMELRMKCGVGKCGRCNIGDKYVCKDGPVFRFDQLDELPNEY